MNFAGVQSVTIPEGDVKSIAIGGVTVWTKPNPLPYDAEVEYVESTGAQYVDTGIAPSDSVGVWADFMILGANENSRVFGVYETIAGTAVRYCGVCRTKTSKKWYYGWGAAYEFSLPTIPINERHQIGLNYLNSRTGAWDGTAVGSALSTLPSFTKNIYLFTTNALNGGVDQLIPQRIYSCSISDGSTLVRSFVPVRVGQVGYLFDRVSGQLFGNAGTGDFVLGPDKNGA